MIRRREWRRRRSPCRATVPASCARRLGAAMKMSVDVSFDPAHGYVGTAPELRTPVRALSLKGCGSRSRTSSRARTSTSGWCSTAAPGWSATPGAGAAKQGERLRPGAVALFRAAACHNPIRRTRVVSTLGRPSVPGALGARAVQHLKIEPRPFLHIARSGAPPDGCARARPMKRSDTV